MVEGIIKRINFNLLFINLNSTRIILPNEKDF